MFSTIARPTARTTRYAAAVIVVLLSVTLLGACGGSSSGGVRTSSSAGSDTDSEYSGACPTSGNTKAFAKTRFALHSGLALGAFHRYVYKPTKNGTFAKGAPKRTRSFAKAAVAGVFTVHELKVAKRFALANPTLCNSVQSISDKFNSLTGKLKSGTATQADIDADENAFTAFQQDASSAGFGFKEKKATVPGAA